MAFEHAQTAWSEWLKTVQAGRPPNVKVTGQPIADELQAGVQVADLQHLAAPLAWNVAGFYETAAAVAGQYSRFEMICTRPTWVLQIQAGQDCIVGVRDVLTLVAHALPVTIFSGTAENLLQSGASALPAPVATEYRFDPTAVALWLPPPALPLFVERGKVLELLTPAVNAELSVGLIWREIPLTR